MIQEVFTDVGRPDATTAATDADAADAAVRPRELLPVVLTGGPADGHWYWPADFAARQLAARRMAAVHHRHRLDPAGWPLLYAPTVTLTHHRRHPEQRAVRWVWTGPMQVTSIAALSRLHAAALTGSRDGGLSATGATGASVAPARPVARLAAVA